MSDAGIAGDFIGLLARNGIEPVRCAAGPERMTQTEGTTVFAFHYRDGVLMAGDRRATAGNIIVTDRIDKIIDLDGRSLLAIAGVPAMAFEMARVLQTSFEYFRRSQLQPLSLAARVRSLARLLRENLPLTVQGIGVVAPLFVGLEETATPPEPKIYFYDPLGAQFQAVGFAASGSGSGTVRSVLAFQESHGDSKPGQMDLAAATRFALRVLITASEFDSATGGVDPERGRFALIRTLTHEGTHIVDEDEQLGFFTA